MHVTLQNEAKTDVCGTSPATLLYTLCERLATRGLKVAGPQHPDSSLAKVTGRTRAYCEIVTDSDQDMRCEYFSPHGSRARPAEISHITGLMLGAESGAENHEDQYRWALLKGAVALDMKARGLTADLDVIEDHNEYAAFADVVITNPAQPDRGQVRLDDTGWVSWQCEADELAGGTEEIVDTIAEILTPLHPMSLRDRLRACLQTHRLSPRSRP